MKNQDDNLMPPLSPLTTPLSGPWLERLGSLGDLQGAGSQMPGGIVVAEMLPPTIAEIESLSGRDRRDFARAFKIALCPGGEESEAMEAALRLGFQEFLTLAMGTDELQARLQLARRKAERRWARRGQESRIKKSFFLGLPGQDTLLDWVRDACEALEPDGDNARFAALLILDIDSFRRFTAIYGLKAGDDIIKEVGRRLRACLDENFSDGGDGARVRLAMLARDEFGLLLDGLDKVENAALFAEKLCHLFDQPLVLAGNEAFITASIGIAMAPMDATVAEDLISRARSAMGHAKDLPSTSYQFYSPAMAASEEERHQIENRLRNILEAEELELKYQPQVEISSGRITGTEALVRWRDPTFGAMAPDAFLAIADEVGLMPEIGHWILAQSLKDARAWHDRGRPLSLAVNVTPSMLLAPGFVGEVKALIEKSGFPVAFLTLEVTETAFLRDRKKGARILHELKGLGLRIALDDFGTGYSSMSYLKDLPLDYLKIDRAFVKDMTLETHGRAIVAAITGMAKAMGMGVLAEGVETEDQLAELESLGLDHYQGYLCSVPVSADEIEELVMGQGGD